MLQIESRLKILGVFPQQNAHITECWIILKYNAEWTKHWMKYGPVVMVLRVSTRGLGRKSLGKRLPIVHPFLFGSLESFVHGLLVLSPALWAVPLAFGFVVKADAGEVKPFDGAFVIIAANHLSERDLLTQAVCGLVRINGQVRWWRLSVLLGFWSPLLFRRRWRSPGLSISWGSHTHVFTEVQAVVGVVTVFGATFLPSRAFSTRFIHWSRCLVSLSVCAGFAQREQRSGQRRQGHWCHSSRGSTTHRHSALRWALAGPEKLCLPLKLPAAVLHQFHHLACDLDLLISKFLGVDQRALNAVQETAPQHRVCFLTVSLIRIVQLLQRLCEISNYIN